MQGKSFVLVPEDWLNEISGKLDRLLEAEPVGSEPDQTMTAAEAAAYLQMDKNTVYRWARADKIPHVRVGSKLFFYKTELDDWMRRR